MKDVVYVLVCEIRGEVIAVFGEVNDDMRDYYSQSENLTMWACLPINKRQATRSKGVIYEFCGMKYKPI